MEMAQDSNLKLSGFDKVAVYVQAGDFARDIGLLSEARVEYERGYDLIKQSAEQEPNHDKARANMAVMLLRRGNMTWAMKGDVETARKDFEKARDLRQEIADHPLSGEYSAQNNRIALSYSAIDQGRLEIAQGNLTAAREYFARALDARRAWVKEPGTDPPAMAPSFLSEACMWMVVVLAHQGDQEGADKLLQEAVNLSEQVAEQDKNDLTFQKDLVDVYGVRGDVQALRGDWERASANYLKAKEHAAKLLKIRGDAAVEVLLARTIERLGAAADKKDDAGDARGRRKMSLQLRETLTRIEPDCVSWKAAWLLALAHMDRQEDDEAATLAKRAAGNCELLLQLARYHAVRAGKAAAPAQRRAAAEQALALLGDAVKAGYADRFTLAGDPDLASLRQESGFQDLLKRLAR
jgi:tetratricopeptide (TPR) repeat protein